jgi:hypothetical protein
MLSFSKGAVVAALALGSLAVQSVGASAMPMVDVNPAIVAHSEAASGVQQTRWVCGPYRCFWRPNYYGYGFYGRPWGSRGGYGWNRGWGWRGGGWRGGWHRGWGGRGYGWHRRW